MQNSLFSNGNLIISGEYFVLTGAKALAVPLRYGQSMKIEWINNSGNSIQWQTNELGIPWFRADINCEDLNITSASDFETATGLVRLLKRIRNIKTDFFRKGRSYIVSCEIEFNLCWGWGSSSTLISNLANYAGIDPFELNKLTSSGSGYDIAASLSPAPIFYQLKEKTHEINPVAFNPVFKNFIWFLYLGRKQNTSTSIENNLKSVEKNKTFGPVITSLTEIIATGENMEDFIRSISEHEKIIAATLNMTRIKEKYFSDFEGEIKSLGAWGGDFAMVVSPLNETDIRHYFFNKGLEILFGFDEIVKF
jgi:mevalonate kinase